MEKPLRELLYTIPPLPQHLISHVDFCYAIYKVGGAANTPGHAVSEAHKRKLDKSWESCNRQGICFLPIAVESLGAWHPSAIVELKRLGSALASKTQGRGGGRHHRQAVPEVICVLDEGQRCPF